MNKVARFFKISEENYNSIIKQLEEKCEAERIYNHRIIPYDKIILPKRKTDGSCGYDFFSTMDVRLHMGEAVTIPTLIRAQISPGWFMAAFPRSSLGFKYNMMLANTVGIIDSDYYYSTTTGLDNEGHIMIRIVNNSNSILNISAGDRFCQGIFLPYGICYDEDESSFDVRNGGIGSTGKS